MDYGLVVRRVDNLVLVWQSFPCQQPLALTTRSGDLMSTTLTQRAKILHTMLNLKGFESYDSVTGETLNSVDSAWVSEHNEVAYVSGYFGAANNFLSIPMDDIYVRPVESL